MATSLLVPVHLDALLVTQETYVRRGMANFAALPYFDGQRDVHPDTPYLSEAILAKPYQDRDLPLKQGVHLHWALPDGLTKTMSLPFVRRQSFVSVFGQYRGLGIWRALLQQNWLVQAGHGMAESEQAVARVAGASERRTEGREFGEDLLLIEQLLAQYAFPAVPNRWLVIRALAGQAKGWVIESDYLFDAAATGVQDDTMGSITFPVDPARATDPPYRYMGRRVALGEWQEEGVAKPGHYLADPLSAVGYGEPTFAAFYPNCYSVFGFYDDIFAQGIKPDSGDLNQLRYLLFGWYSDLQRDYLRTFLTDYVTEYQTTSKDHAPPAVTDQIRAVESEFGWTIEGVPAAMPQRVVCHAELRFGVSGTPQTSDADTAEVTVAIGNNGTEALSAFLSRHICGDNPPQAVEDHLEAARLAGQIGEGVLDVGASFREERHNKSFTAVPGGTLWTVRQLGKEGERADAVEAHKRTQVTPDLKLAHLLHEANERQRAYDQARWEIDSLRHRLFGDWTRYMQVVYPPPYVADRSYDSDRVRYFIEEGDLRSLKEKTVATGVLLLRHDEAGHIAGAALADPGQDSLARQLATRVNDLVAAVRQHDQPRKTTFYFSSFDGSSELFLTGSAGEAGGKMRLAGGGEAAAGAAWFTEKQRVAGPFTTSFVFQIARGSRATGGAGLAFVIQNYRPQAVGTAGSGLGYSGIPNSLAIEFDTFQDGAPVMDPDNNHVSVQTRGSQPNDAAFSASIGRAVRSELPDLADGRAHTVTVDYEPGTLRVGIDERQDVLVVEVNLAARLDLDGGQAWVGLTAASGESGLDHSILKWAFAEVLPSAAAQYVVDRVAAPRFWRPNEPVVLLAGIEANLSERHGQDGRLRKDGLLLCQVMRNDFPDPPSKEDIQALPQAVDRIPTYSFALKTWQQQPWHPFLLEWQVELYPTLHPDDNRYPPAYPPGYVRDNYRLPLESVEFSTQQPALSFDRDPRPYSGTSVLTPHAARQLQVNLEDELVRLIKPYLLRQFAAQKLGLKEDDPLPADADLVGSRQADFEAWGQAQEPPLWGSLASGQTVKGSALSAFQQVHVWLHEHMGETNEVPAAGDGGARYPGIAAWYTRQKAGDVAGATTVADRQQRFTVTAGAYERSIASQYTALRAALNAPNPQAADIEAKRRALHETNLEFATLTLAVAYDALDRNHFLSQALSGFNDALLGRRQTLQLPVADPLGFAVDMAFAQQVADAVLDANRSAALPFEDFTPLRAGALNISGMRLVDTFGRTKTVPSKALRAVVTPSGLRGTGRFPVHLPPRLAQAALLNFRWLSAEDSDVEANAHPVTSPVCGWLLANNLDNSIMVYDQTGQALGSLVAADTTRPWHPAPGYDQPLMVEDIANDTLRSVVGVLVKCQLRSPGVNGSSEHRPFLDHFVRVLDSALVHIDPESFGSHQARALLMSRPVAVVRARVDLSLQGLAANDESWSAFGRDLSAWETSLLTGTGAESQQQPQRSTRSFENVSVAVRIGEYEQLNDGLVGYWLAEDPANRDGDVTFYALQGDHVADDHPIVTRSPRESDEKAFAVPLTWNGPPQYLTMLVDPRGSVHATCGILPTKELHIPSEQYSAALAAIQVTFLTTPLLTGADRINVSLPHEPGFAWSWVGKEDGGWREVGTTGVLQRETLEVAFSGNTISAGDVWDTLLAQGWLQPSGVDTAKVVPADRRTERELPERFRDAVSKIEEILARTHINSFRAEGHLAGRQVIREGWLKLQPTESEET